jgi:acetoin utilization deacetylase AcuC-like enzyme
MADLFRRHDPGPHPERPARYDAVSEAVAASGAEAAEAPPAPLDALLEIHDRRYLEALERICAEGGGALDPDTVVNGASYDAAVRASGAAMAAVDAVLSGDVRAAFTCGRPPGHHAERATPMGFCIINHVAVAAAHARAAGVERVAVLDWDAHHGNGTQAAFWDDPSVLTISLHQAGCFPPDSGAVGELGGAGALGSNINLPLPPGSGAGAFAAAFDHVVLPALERFAPDLVLIACGYDSCAWDAHARLMLHSESYRQLTRALLEIADRHAQGRLVVIHEGGYAPAYAPYCGLAVLEELSDIRTEAEDPFLSIFEGYGYQDVQPHQQVVIAEAAALLGLAGE